MLKSHGKFHSASGRRLIMVVDDELINREMMRMMLESDYEVICAENGLSAMKLIRENRETLSLVLLDLMMPVMSGKEVLRLIREDPSVRNIPVIVLTADAAAEVESLNLGAADFIPKPYPDAGVVLARIQRTIELSEDRQILTVTERDSLTNLYTRGFFYLYAEQYDQHHRDLDMDAMIVDVNHFHMINERFGSAYGDRILQSIGARLLEKVAGSEGMVCRPEADTFMVYCPHGQDYQDLLDYVSDGLAGDDSVSGRVRLRMGVYMHADKSLEMTRRFDRAKQAADTVKGSFTRTIGFYDSTLHEKELYAEQLIEDFDSAIREKQFLIFYQPKFDVRPDIPFLTSAEALVRWQHPTLGMISPGIFIPLFEENGLIQTLDDYVWRMAAEQIRDWKDRLSFSVPVSVNVSRIDMYDPGLIGNLQNILRENSLTPADLFLEITESAYTQNSGQIIGTVSRLRELGFRIEMDDFGTGYSSLNMIGTLPIDALKLDMQFIRTAFSERRDTRMLEVIIDIADYLNVPVIAEGVETEEQFNALKAMGCDIIQGYYFSRPVPPESYERFVVERRDSDSLPEQLPRKRHSEDAAGRDMGFGKIAYALSSGFESVYYVDTDNNHYVQFSSEGKYEDLQIEHSGSDFFSDTQRNIPRVVWEADQARMALCLQKDALLAQLMDGHPYSMTYRLILDGKPVYYSLKVVRAEVHDEHHIVIGVSNVDDQIRQAGRTEESLNQMDFDSLARALSGDMESIYYVDIGTDTYMEYLTDHSAMLSEPETSGRDFFRKYLRRVTEAVAEEDRERVSDALRKEEILAALGREESVTLDFRMVRNGTPVFYRMKISSAGKQDRQHIIIGISNMDARLNEEQRQETIRQNAATYARIAQALATDYFSIYYVNMQNDRFVEYRPHAEYQELDIEKGGEDFFRFMREDIRESAFAEDVEGFLKAFTRENVLKEMETCGSFTLTWRMLFGGEPAYVHMKATRMADRNDPHIVIGISNIDAQMRREQEHAFALRSAREIANRDSLTGVKSKHAYTEKVSMLDESIRTGQAEPFALVLCDVNGLKEINDTQGHAAGDELIRSACRRVCHIFDHSPVYRYGGDEFVVLLSGHDFEHREELLLRMSEENRNGSGEAGAVTVACGIALYRPGEDRNAADVFARADTAMYENKKQIKGERMA